MPLAIEKLRREHKVEGFDCGQEALNRFLVRFALQSQLSNSSQTYIARSGDSIIGYYTLVFGDVAFDDAPERLRKGVARHPVPLMILARLAVSLSWHRKGVGSGLLKDAMLRTLAAADIAGLRAFDGDRAGENMRPDLRQIGVMDRGQRRGNGEAGLRHVIRGAGDGFNNHRIARFDAEHRRRMRRKNSPTDRGRRRR